VHSAESKTGTVYDDPLGRGVYDDVRDCAGYVMFITGDSFRPAGVITGIMDESNSEGNTLRRHCQWPTLAEAPTPALNLLLNLKLLLNCHVCLRG
jgi:hypothetical protein